MYVKWARPANVKSGGIVGTWLHTAELYGTSTLMTGGARWGVESLSIPALPEVAISIPTELMF